MSNESREAFEASKIMSGANTGKSVGQLGIKYANPTVQLMWVGWQASRKQAFTDVAVVATVGATYPELMDYIQGELK